MSFTMREITGFSGRNFYHGIYFNELFFSWEIASLVKGRQLTIKLLNERAECSSQSSFMKRGGDLLWTNLKEVIPHWRLEFTGDQIRIVRLSEAAAVVRNIPENYQNTKRIKICSLEIIFFGNNI